MNTSPVASENDGPYLSAKMMKSLVENTTPNETAVNIIEMDEDPVTVNLLSIENVEEVIQSMGISQRLEFCGSEYVAGFVASKVADKHPEL